MTFEGLRCFCALVESGSFHGAAERVHKTQPAVTQQVKGLEREFGQLLFDRKRGTATAAGREVYARGSALLHASGDLSRALRDFDEGGAAALRVGCSDTNALYFLPRHIRGFSTVMPGTRLEVVTRASSEIALAVERGSLDLGIVTLPVDRDALEERPLFAQRLVAVAPRSHALCGKKRVSLNRLKDEAFVLLEEKTRTGRLLRAHFRENDFDPQVAMDSGSFEVIKRYVMEGIGVSILPEMVVDEDAALCAVHVAGLPSIQIGAVWRRGGYLTKAAQAFLEMIS